MAPARHASAAMSRWRLRAILLGPALAYWLAFLVVPVGLVLAYSLMTRGQFGGVVPALTLDNYLRALDPLYVGVLLGSLRMAAIATVVALLIGYPTAYFIATRPRRWRTPLLIIVILPFWTSFLIRTYAWVVLLNREGLINRPLLDAGIIGEPLPLLNNEFSIILGLVYIYLPLMILPLYASLERINPELREASTDLGASPLRTFLTVTLPLSSTGIVGGRDLRLRAEPRELHRPRAARRRPAPDDRQPHPGAVPARPRLAVRRGARRRADRDHHRPPALPGVAADARAPT